MAPRSINLCLLPPPHPTPPPPPLPSPPKKTGVLADLGRRTHRVMFQAQIQAGALDEELTSTQYIVLKTSYIDMSSRFTAPHCFCCYQAINSRVGMNWLTLRVASVASCNLIPYIISPSCFFLIPHKHVCCQINPAYIYISFFLFFSFFQQQQQQQRGCRGRLHLRAQVAGPLFLPSFTAPCR